MSKRVLIISTSLRQNANSHLLAQQFAEGARQAGHEVELISLAEKDIRFCKGCLACQTTAGASSTTTRTPSCRRRCFMPTCWCSPPPSTTTR